MTYPRLIEYQKYFNLILTLAVLTAWISYICISTVDDTVTLSPESIAASITDFNYTVFPKIAYTILISGHFSNFERLLRSIYSKNDVYCIHIDAKISNSSQYFQNVTHLIAKLTQNLKQKNIYLIPNRENVIYASFIRLQAELNCIKFLMDNFTFDYYINLCERDLPLNRVSLTREILSKNYPKCYVRFRSHSLWYKRWLYSWKIQKNSPTTSGNTSSKNSENSSENFSDFYSGGKMINTFIKKNQSLISPMLKPFYSSDAYVIISKPVMNLIFESNSTRRLEIDQMLEFFQDSYSPDETFWATIAGNFEKLFPEFVEQFPKSYFTCLENDQSSRKFKPSKQVFLTSEFFSDKARFITAKWYHPETKWRYPNRTCYGQLLRQMCVYGEDDFETLMLARQEGYLFANKFDDAMDVNISKKLLEAI